MIQTPVVGTSIFTQQVLSLAARTVTQMQASRYGFVRAVGAYMTPKLMVVSFCFQMAISNLLTAYFSAKMGGSRIGKLTTSLALMSSMMWSIMTIAALILLPSP